MEGELSLTLKSGLMLENSLEIILWLVMADALVVKLSHLAQQFP